MHIKILDLAVTLYGFIEGPNGEIDWCIMDEDMKEMAVYKRLYINVSGQWKCKWVHLDEECI